MSTGGIYAIETRKLNVWIDNKLILDNINIKVPREEITAILGPSGSGKSTMLRVLNRLIELVDGARVEGEAFIFGKSVFETNVYELRREVGMVFQEPNPFPHLSIYDNVALGPRLHRTVRDKKDLDSLVRRSLEMAGLWDEVKDRLRDPPWKLSGGQQQRLCLARALALRPKLLLLDEPTSNIDPINTKKIEETLRRLAAEEGISIVLVTHMPHQAVRLSSYIIVLYQGRVVEEGPTSDIALTPKSEITKRYMRGEV